MSSRYYWLIAVKNVEVYKNKKYQYHITTIFIFDSQSSIMQSMVGWGVCKMITLDHKGTWGGGLGRAQILLGKPFENTHIFNMHRKQTILNSRIFLVKQN